ncbi:expressed unknown protein [Seminavis robusta]|uniref:DUF2061 domain-containing protein n=1 Tax=Seminavis robusta TaxID=568900 RepID=A0A9N8DQ17_9STRA|nr:expressed unknown protein [Seminavis robusta]|eukprot:Sro289_g109140.1 n/a (262) ;mRNA; f:51362-52147
MFRLLLVSALPLATLCFSLRPATQLRPFLIPVSISAASPVRVPRSDLAITAGAFFSANGDEPQDAVLRSLEKKEAKMRKQAEEAQSKLSMAEATIEMLQSKKQEYLNGLSLAKTPPGGNFSETAVRSAVKAFLWRIVAGTVTFITSYRFSGSVTTALSIVGSDFFSKAFTMFFGERLMNKSKAGRASGSDGIGRSLTKALIWRLFAIANTLTMAFFVAKDLSIASKIAGSDAIFKTALMFFYERIWARIQWGKEYEIEFSI